MCIYEATATRAGNQKGIEVSQTSNLPQNDGVSIISLVVMFFFLVIFWARTLLLKESCARRKVVWRRCLTEREKTTSPETHGTKSKKETN